MTPGAWFVVGAIVLALILAAPKLADRHQSPPPPPVSTTTATSVPAHPGPPGSVG